MNEFYNWLLSDNKVVETFPSFKKCRVVNTTITIEEYIKDNQFLALEDGKKHLNSLTSRDMDKLLDQYNTARNKKLEFVEA